MSTHRTGGRRKDRDLDDAVRDMLLLLPRLVGRAKSTPLPAELQHMSLGPRHLSLLAYLLFDGPMTVNDLAVRLEVAPTTTSLMVAELSRAGVLDRAEDPADRRRRIVNIAEAKLPVIEKWLAAGVTAWRNVLGPLSPGERRLVVETLTRYEQAVETLIE